jgi:peptidoglycan/xylan/chitin deacetylase (PgdA/CDA1 family)
MTFLARSRQSIAHAPAVVRALSWMVRRKTFPGMAVLCYHAIRPDRLPDGAMAFEGLHLRTSRFAEHMEVLSRDCHPLSLDDWRRVVAGARPLPARAVHVTFDDGYRSVLHEALPVLERYQVPATVFLCTGPTERREKYWYDAVAQQAGADAAIALKTIDHADWQRRVAECDRALTRDDDPHAPLTVDEVRCLAAHPLIEIGGHTHNHPVLARACVEVQQSEFARCRTAIEQWSGRTMRAFAYPNGRAGIDFTADTVRLAREAGVDCAFTADAGFARVTDDPLAHPRFMMTADVSAGHLLHRLSREWH